MLSASSIKIKHTIAFINIRSRVTTPGDLSSEIVNKTRKKKKKHLNFGKKRDIIYNNECNYNVYYVYV